MLSPGSIVTFSLGKFDDPLEIDAGDATAPDQLHVAVASGVFRPPGRGDDIEHPLAANGQRNDAGTLQIAAGGRRIGGRAQQRDDGVRVRRGALEGDLDLMPGMERRQAANLHAAGEGNHHRAVELDDLVGNRGGVAADLRRAIRCGRARPAEQRDRREIKDCCGNRVAGPQNERGAVVQAAI